MSELTPVPAEPRAGALVVRGARTHNLKGVDLTLPMAVAYVLAVGRARLCDEGELRAERQRYVTDQATQELVTDRTRGPFGHRAQQVPAAKTRIGLVCMDRRRHDPLPGIDATE